MCVCVARSRKISYNPTPTPAPNNLNGWTDRIVSKGARFLKIDFAQFSSQKRFYFRGGVLYTYPILLLKQLRQLNKKWYPGGIQMMHTVVLYCQKLVWGINKYQTIFLHPKTHFLCYKCHLRYIFNYTL